MGGTILMAAFCRRALGFAVCVGLLLGGSIRSDAAGGKRVLIVRDESPEMPGGRVLVDQIETTLRKSNIGPVEFFIETLDTRRFTGDQYERRLADLLVEKYATMPLDLVVAYSEPAFKFVARARETVFPRSPILFGLVDQRYVNPDRLPPNSAVVYVQLDALGTARLALRAYPKARRLLVIGGSSRFDRGWQRVIREDLKPLSTTIPIEYDVDSSVVTLTRRVAALPSDTAVLYTWMTRDGAGTPTRPVDVLEALRAVSPVPIFGLSSTYVGHGVLGGVMVDFTAHGQELGDAAARMLAGTMPVPSTTRSAIAFDLREMKRFGVSNTVLPPETVLAFRELTLWEREKNTILIAALIVSIETALVLALFIAVRRRRQGQRELQESDRLKTAILASLPAHVAVLDRDGAVIAATDSWAVFGRSNGIACAGVAGDPACADCTRAACVGASETLKAIAAVCRGGSAGRQLEYRSSTPVGERWFLMTAEPLRRPERGAVVTHLDITERKVGEMALRESEDRFRRMADSLPVAIWMSDTTGDCIYVNKLWLEMVGRDLREEIGIGWLESVHPADRTDCRARILTAFAAREPFRIEYRVRARDGEWRTVIDTGMPRYGSDGAFHGYVGGCLDITERTHAEQALHDVNLRLMGAQDDERRRIARDLHDHLSQQLALLAIDLQQLSMQSPAPTVDLKPLLQEAWRRTTEIASDVHAISHRLHPSKMESLGLVATIKGHCRELSRQHVAVEFMSEDVPRDIPADRALSLFRVVEEALSNVQRHSGASSARVVLAWGDDQVFLRVTDNGKGFKKNRKPSGIGLVSMRERVQSLEGTLDVLSRPGRGTVVEARIPTAALRPAAQGSPTARAESA